MFALTVMPAVWAFSQAGLARMRRATSLLWLLVCVAGLSAVPTFAQGIITTVAGNGSRGFSGDGGAAVNALIDMKSFTGGVAADAAGNVYLADTGNHRVRKIDSSVIISTIAGNGSAKFSGDGASATNASLFAPTGLTLDAAGTLYIVDTGNQRIRRVSPNGIITTVAGNGVRGFSGDGGIATAASLSLGNVQYLGTGGYPTSVAVDGAGNLYIPDTENGRVRMVSPSGIITTVVAALRDPYGAAVDAAGNLFITDGSNDQILKVSPSGAVTTIATALSSPSGVALDRAGNLYIADSHSHRIRKVEPSGVTSVIAGSGDPIFDPIEGYYLVGGFSGDGGPATSAQLNFPWGVAVDAVGNVYIADSLNNRIRKVTAAGNDNQGTFTSPFPFLLYGPFESNTSAITVSDLPGTVSKVTASISFGDHPAPPADLAFLLVGPNGQSSILMSGVSVDKPFGLTLTFDDAAPSSLTNNPASGTYKPSPLGLGALPPPAPSDSYGTTLSVFNGTSPNGEWKLYAVNFVSNSACAILGENCTVVGGWSLTITTTPALPNRIDDLQFFVHQQYLDFLNREPDQSGWEFWMDQITSCGFDQQCIEVKRINVSAAYFLSIEFQQTGYLVYRMYKTAYGNLPDAPVPIRFSEFLADTQQIGHGVVVLQPGWETILENNKQAFSDEFVNRSRFTAAYPSTMTPDEFVDTLINNTGSALSQTERDHLVIDLATGVRSRAQVQRAVAENQNLADAEFNRAFVLMQYFGYLRRDPNSAPDSDFSGYNFWLNKLNFFHGDFVSAEMVKAFITSTEYRQRFAP
jgi:sugar lactone lactonase YvrE